MIIQMGTETIEIVFKSGKKIEVDGHTEEISVIEESIQPSKTDDYYTGPWELQLRRSK